MMVVNIYDKLGIPFTATPDQIQRAIRKAAEKQSLEPNKLRQCRDWLLNPETRARYDARLLAENPHLNQSTTLNNQNNSNHSNNTRKFVNIYAKLGINMDATTAEIQQAIRKAELNQTLSPNNLKKCQAVLLSPTNKAKYDEKLLLAYPELNQLVKDKTKIKTQAKTIGNGSYYDFIKSLVKLEMYGVGVAGIALLFDYVKLLGTEEASHTPHILHALYYLVYFILETIRYATGGY